MEEENSTRSQEKKRSTFAATKSALQKREIRIKVGLKLITYLILACAAFIFLDVIFKGAPVVFQSKFPFINTEFFTSSPETLVVYEDEEGAILQSSATDFEAFRQANPDAAVEVVDSYSYSGGGILGPLVGTALLVIICMIIALGIGIASAVFLNEYSRGGRFIDMIRLAIINLAGVPSIVFGLFGLGFFCYAVPNLVAFPADRSLLAIPLPFTEKFLSFEGWDACMLSGGCTLALMVLPVIIAACEESLKAVPMGFREASLALGATKWQTIRKSVLPYAFPGMLTASILGITRVAGETAPIMFTAAVAHKDKLPWQDLNASGLGALFEFLFQKVQALPYHIYTVSAKIPQSEYNKPMQYGSVFVFMLLVLIFASLSIYLRILIRKKVKW
ncbi:MAG: phosphate ABC transporter permease PstA [Verrucomicrobiota bacterium]